MFEDFFFPYIAEIRDDILKKVENDGYFNKQCENIAEFSRLFHGIYDNLFRLSIRALIRELHIYNESGELDGLTSEERYLFFEKIIAEEKNRASFFKKYPVLEQKIKRYINNISEYIYFILRCYRLDKLQIESLFSVKLSQIIDIAVGSGDTHNDGKSVAIIYFENVKFVFKPHDLVSDDVFEKIILWINQNADLKYDLNKAKSLSMESRGWQEFIEYTPCDCVDQANRFYYRMGCFLAIFYSLGTTDLHFENVIACSENPMFIDLETLLTNRRINKMQTVLEMGLLPQPTDQIFDVDISGICGKNNKSMTLKTLVIKNKMTDEMYVDEVPAEIKNQQNIVIINNVRINIQDYATKILEGFQKTIDFMIKNKDKYLDLLNSIISEREEFRIVLRHTTVYSKYHAASLHPDYLTSSRQHEKLYTHLKKNCKDSTEKQRVQNEIDTLLKGDVPYYIFRFKSLDLYDYKGVVCKNYFSKGAYEIIADRINNIKKNKLANIGLIKKSLYTAYLKENMEEKLDLIYNRTENNLTVIQELVDRVIEHIFYQDEDTILYYINSLYNNRVYLKPINSDLYEGGGIIALLASYGTVRKEKKYVETAKKLLYISTEIMEYKIRRQQEEIKISAFSGYGSLLYINYFLYFLTGDNDYKSKGNILTSKIESIIDKKEIELLDNDLLGGLAGCIVFLSHILLKEQNDEIEKLLKKIAKLFEKKEYTCEIKGIGLGHGLSGYAYAFCMLFMVTKEQKYYLRAKELLDREDCIYDTREAEYEKVTWCKGETGMCISRLKLLEIHRDNNTIDSLSKYYAKVTSDGLFRMNNMCLCHGVFGNIEVIRRINEQSDMPIVTIMSNNDLDIYERKLFKKLDHMKFGYNNNFYPDTFMNGFTGVAYELLREEYKRLPSMLFLEV